MKKIVISCGLISGFIITAMMIITISRCYNNADFEGNEVVGYTTMLLAFSLIFIGIKKYRDKYRGGIISFGKAFRIGLYITLVSSTVYVVAWLFYYYLFVPDFIERYTAYVLKQVRADGATQQEINNKATEMASFKKMYKNPVLVVLITYSEILPMGLIISLISALLLKRKRNTEAQVV